MQTSPQNLQNAPSFSVHSVADSSGPAISEVEEIHEVHKLLRTGEHAFKTHSFHHALRCYNEALEIDDLSLESYAGRAAVYIELGNYILAQRDAEKVITMEPDNTQGHYLLGIALHNLGHFKESLVSFLKALDLDSDNHHVDVLTNNIATIASQISDIPDDLLNDIPGMDPYKKLTEVGCCLYSSKKFDTCIRVLNAAQKLETNQKGITMKVQLTLANAHAALKHNELAISLYQDCLQTALSAHDASYQTKALVSTASLFLELGDTHSAIVHYQKLLDLQRELQGEEMNAPLPDYWSMDLQCALHLNLSIAYKTIGSMQKAIQHAEIYCSLIKNYEPESRRNAQAQSHQNVGMLHELLGNFTEALEHYKKYLKLSKCSGDKVGMAQAYGCLGSVYGALRNATLAMSYHQQHVNIAQSLQHVKMLCTAWELQGDTYMVLKQYECATDSYTQMVESCHHSDIKGQSTALCKLGTAYRKMKKHPEGIFYLEQAKQLAEEYKYNTIRIMCDLHLACMLQHSSHMSELERARTHFTRLLPVFEAKLQQHQEEDTFCPQELRAQVDECYDGLQNVLAKIGYSDECLQYSETQKKKQVVDLLQMQHVSGTKYTLTLSLYESWTVDRMSRVVSQQNATVLYYKVLPSQLLLWVLQPGEGVVRFYNGKSLSVNDDYDKLLLKLIEQIKGRRDMERLKYECENRALTFKDDELERKRNENKKLSKAGKNEEQMESSNATQNMSEKPQMRSSKSAERQLFDILIAPVDDILCKLEEGAPVVIIPDSILCHCPFAQIKDWNSKTLQSRVRISCCPSLFTLDRVVQNELNHLKLQDDLEFERAQARLGGIAKTMQNIDFMKIAVGSLPDTFVRSEVSNAGTSGKRLESRSSSSERIDPKRVSNPRLLTSGKASRLDPLSRDSTLLSIKSKGSLASIKEAPSTPRSKKGQQVNFTLSTASSNKPQTTKTMATIDKMFAGHTLTTLTTRTSTNTDITQSHQVVTDFKQISDKDKCVVIGAPLLPDRLLLHGGVWSAPGDLLDSQTECFKVAENLDVTAIVGSEATKQRFLKEVQTAAVLHIATYACLKENLLVFCPNPNRHETGLATMHSYVVRAEDIVELKLVARLVVLSCGVGPFETGYLNEGFVLASAFLTAGAQCVVSMLWSLPNKALDKFFYHFYSTLQKGAYVTKAIVIASEQLQQDHRYKDLSYHAAPVVIGKDTYLSIKFIRHAQLDQIIDKVEEEVCEVGNRPPLNPRPLLPNVNDREANLRILQECIASLLASHVKQPLVIGMVTALIDDAIKRLHVSDINHRTVTLPRKVPESEGAIRLVKFLGFHFQPQNQHFSEPYVIFPHWNHDDLLIPAYESLRAIAELTENAGCCRAMHELLPTTQQHISYMVDMFCITKHAPEIQLKVTDLSVKPLWKARCVRPLLYHLGYHQIGTLLYFNNVPSTRKLLTACLQMLIAVSNHKSVTLLHKLDVSLLGAPASTKGSTTSLENAQLPSLTPLLLPRNQLRMTTPWLSTVERTEEMNEKIKLSRNASDLTSEYKFYVSKARTWHEASVSVQAEESLDAIGRPESMPLKVKVFPGSSQSQHRIPLSHKRGVTLPETDVKRDYAHYILKQRLGGVELRHKNHMRKLYMPYIVNA